MATETNLSHLMQISWDIQRTKRKNRSKALQAAWAIMQCESVTVQYLTRKLNRNKPVPLKVAGQYGLFNS